MWTPVLFFAMCFVGFNCLRLWKTAHVVFDTPSSAAAAVTKLHAHVYKGCLLSVTLKRRLDTLVKPAKTSDASPTLSRASRLIVRNLPWSITEQDLRALFLPYGPIYSIHIPSSSSGEDGASQVKKGFAFVWMLSKQDAVKAIEGCNGRTVKAGLAEDLVGDKQKRKKQKRMEKKRVEMQGANADADGDGEEPTVGGEKERVIAVDWALSKAKWTEELAKAREVSEDDAENHDDATGSESDEDEGEDEGGDEGEVLGVHEGHVDDDESEEETEGDRATEDTRTEPQLPPPETGTTLFIRNVPFAATDDELRTLYVRNSAPFFVLQ
jgi:nucleolar protein 4